MSCPTSYRDETHHRRLWQRSPKAQGVRCPPEPGSGEPAHAKAGFAEEAVRAAALVSQAKQVVVSLFAEARMGKALDTSGCADLVNEVTASVWRNPGAMVSLARLKTHDDYTYMHSVAVCALMVALARQLGMSEEEAREAGMAGLLHDMGKAAMPLEVLTKPGKLTDQEFALMRFHPERGHAMLSRWRGRTRGRGGQDHPRRARCLPAPPREGRRQRLSPQAQG